MSNDTSNISGSLLEIIDRLETKIQSKCMPDAEFDATTGILGLINYIDDNKIGDGLTLLSLNPIITDGQTSIVIFF